MPTKSDIFKNYNDTAFQKELENIIYDAIRVKGIDCYFIPRTVDVKDQLLNEAEVATYNRVFFFEMYMKTTMQFGGEMAMLSKFGLEDHSQVTMTISRKAFLEHVTLSDPNIIRPKEGDLVYLPLPGWPALYRITYVDNVGFFYQLGQLQVWDVNMELYELASEKFETGVPIIDNVYNQLTQDLATIAVLTEDDSYLKTEDGWYITFEIEEPLSLSDLTNADNATIEDEADLIIDWSEADPFSDGEY